MDTFLQCVFYDYLYFDSNVDSIMNIGACTRQRFRPRRPTWQHGL